MLLTRADEQDRADARQLASAADQAALQDAQARVARLRDKADDEANAALLDGLARAAGGVCTGASGFFAPATGAADGCQCAPATGGAHGISFNWNSGFKGAGEMGPPIGELLAAPSQAAKGRADADAATFDAQAQAQIRRFERAQNDAQDANQSLERVESFLGQVQQAENATRLTAATYRA